MPPQILFTEVPKVGDNIPYLVSIRPFATSIALQTAQHSYPDDFFTPCLEKTASWLASNQAYAETKRLYLPPTQTQISFAQTILGLKNSYLHYFNVKGNLFVPIEERIDADIPRDFLYLIMRHQE